MGGDQQDGALDELAVRLGIQPDFRDARGKVIQTTSSTKRKLLAAMGMDVADESQAKDALRQLKRQAASKVLPPVLVVTASEQPIAVPVTLPVGARTAVWRVRLESGHEINGEVQFAALPLLDTLRAAEPGLERRALALPATLPWGYHEMTLDAQDASMSLIVAPERCWLPKEFPDKARWWGLTTQLYLLRSANNWGIGDFSDLRSLIRICATRGADVIGLNPLHAMFSDVPEQASPYSPASRLLLNVLNIDVSSVPELGYSPGAQRLIASVEFQQRVSSCRTSEKVAYTEVTDLKLAVLAELFVTCRSSADKTRWRAFEEFRRDTGDILERHCLFLALREHFSPREDVGADWHQWPEPFRDADSAAVKQFSEQQRERVDFLIWMQWIAQEQLTIAAQAAEHHGMRVGLYRDLAVGADKAGAEGWINPRVVVTGAHVGAPPDILNPAGQDWGLPPFSPHALQEEGYASFIQLVRANMRCAGGLRIDHVMALQQLYWIPEGSRPQDGAYVSYPLEDLLAILALESCRHRCLVVGEDLGTVPENFRERLADAGVLSYRVLFFEHAPDGDRFLAPHDYPSLAVAVLGNHDLATLRGWWRGRDLDVKERLGLLSAPGESKRQRQQRAREKRLLLDLLRDEHLWADEGEPDEDLLIVLVHLLLARTNACLALAQIDDLTDEIDSVNVPATSTEYPNWRRRLSLTLDELADSPRFIEVTQALREARPSLHLR
jgi:4-alpha-glucanotransferase